MVDIYNNRGLSITISYSNQQSNNQRGEISCMKQMKHQLQFPELYPTWGLT